MLLGTASLFKHPGHVHFYELFDLLAYHGFDPTRRRWSAAWLDKIRVRFLDGIWRLGCISLCCLGWLLRSLRLLLTSSGVTVHHLLRGGIGCSLLLLQLVLMGVEVGWVALVVRMLHHLRMAAILASGLTLGRSLSGSIGCTTIVVVGVVCIVLGGCLLLLLILLLNLRLWLLLLLHSLSEGLLLLRRVLLGLRLLLAIIAKHYS